MNPAGIFYMSRPSHIFIAVNFKQNSIFAGLRFVFSKDEDWIIARCPELELSDQGKTEAEAAENLSDMIGTTLISAIELGKLESHLEDLGFKGVWTQGHARLFSLDVDRRVKGSFHEIDVKIPRRVSDSLYIIYN